MFQDVLPPYFFITLAVMCALIFFAATFKVIIAPDDTTRAPGTTTWERVQKVSATVGLLSIAFQLVELARSFLP